MIDLYTAETMKLNTEMKVLRFDYDNGVQLDFSITNDKGVAIHRDCVRLGKAQAKQLRVFLQALE